MKIKTKSRFSGKITLAILAALLTISCATLPFLSASDQAGDEAEPRTYYEGLDLASPETAVQTFVDAFSRDDFPTVWLILHKDTQFMIPQRLNLLQYSALIKTDQFDEVKMDISLLSKGLGAGEHSEADAGYVFDQFMLAARKHSAFIIDLTGPVEILSSQSSMTRNDDPAVDVTVKVEQTGETVIFRMAQSLSGRWRVYMVFHPGGENGLPPWGIPEK